MTKARQLAVGVQKPRNYLINGGFDVWQRGTSQTSNGYGSDDRWKNTNAGSTKTHSRQAFSLGQADVPGEPEFYSRTVVSSVTGASNGASKEQRIEGVRTLAGKTSTVTFWAKADASKDMSLNAEQFFGTGGSPSTEVRLPAQKVSLTTSWQRFSLTFAIPSIAGKTLGTDVNDFLKLSFWFDAGSDFNAQTDSLGNQSGTFDIARVSLREGDVTALDDPFEERSYGAELALCQSYYYKTDPITSYLPQAAAGDRNRIVNYPYPVTLRAVPALVVSGLVGGTVTNWIAGVDRLGGYCASTFTTGVYFSSFAVDAEL